MIAYTKNSNNINNKKILKKKTKKKTKTKNKQPNKYNLLKHTSEQSISVYGGVLVL